MCRKRRKVRLSVMLENTSEIPGNSCVGNGGNQNLGPVVGVMSQRLFWKFRFSTHEISSDARRRRSRRRSRRRRATARGRRVKGRKRRTSVYDSQSQRVLILIPVGFLPSIIFGKVLSWGSEAIPCPPPPPPDLRAKLTGPKGGGSNLRTGRGSQRPCWIRRGST